MNFSLVHRASSINGFYPLYASCRKCWTDGTKVFKYICPKRDVMIKGSLPKELEQAFRQKAMEKYGYSKGAVSKALEAAISLWVRYDYESTDEEETNNSLFESMVDELEANYQGMYVVIADGKLVSYKCLDEAIEVKEGRYTHRIVFKVGERPSQKVRLGWRAAIKPVGPT